MNKDSLIYKIYEGNSAEELGIPNAYYLQLKSLLDKFLFTWQGDVDNFSADYKRWLETYKHQMPSISHMVKNFKEAAQRNLTSGFLTVSSTEFEQRLNICNGCIEFKTNTRCALCGCFLSVKLKLALEHCPVKKW